MKKKLLITCGITALIILVIIGIEYIQFLHATSRMKELSANLEKRIVEWEKREYKRPVLVGPVIPGNAAEFYRQAEEQMHKLVDQTDARIEWGEYVGSFKPLSATGISYYEQAKPIIELVRKGNNAETYKSLLNLRQGIKVPALLASRNIANAMVIQGRELENNNRASEALELYSGILMYGDDYVRDGPLLSAMFGIGCFEIGYEEIRSMVLRHRLSNDNLNKLTEYCNTLLSYEPSFQHNYETETLAMISSMKSEMAEKESFPPSFWLKTILSIQAWDDIPPIYKEIGRMTTLPYNKAKDASGKLQERVKWFWNPLTRLLCSSQTEFSSVWHQNRAQRRGLDILCALELYQARHHKYPDKLSDLTSDLPAEASAQAGIIKEVPLDPFSDQPIIYRVQPDGTIMLYSVGENLKDDGGDEKRYNDIVIAPLKGS